MREEFEEFFDFACGCYLVARPSPQGSGGWTYTLIPCEAHWEDSASVSSQDAGQTERPGDSPQPAGP